MTDISCKKGKMPAFIFMTGYIIEPHNRFNNSVPARENYIMFMGEVALCTNVSRL